MATFYFFDMPLSPVALTGKAISTGAIRLYVSGDIKTINITTPEDMTYTSDDYTCSGSGYPKCDDSRYILPLNATVDFFLEQGDSWKYSLYDVTHGVYIEKDTVFAVSITSLNTTINAVRWENLLSVSAKEEDADWVTKEVSFRVEVPDSSPILGDIEDTIYVCESERIDGLIDARFNATDLDEEVLTSYISPKQGTFYTYAFGGGGASPTLFRIISAPLSKSKVGSYTRDISILDTEGLSDSDTVNITVIEINNPPTMQNIGAQTVWTTGVDSEFNYQMNANDVEDGDSSEGNLRFNLTWGSGEDLFDIDSSYGIMNYTPSAGDLGKTFSLTVCVNDSAIEDEHVNFSICSGRGYSTSSISTCDDFTITVTDENRAPEIVSYSPIGNVDVNGTDTISSMVVVTDDDGTIPDIDWYVDGVLTESNEGLSTYTYNYVFGCGVFGNHTIEIITSDGLLSASQKWYVNVTEVTCISSSEVKPSGGGGGGGALGGACSENWVCKDWEICQNAKRSFDIGTISPEDYYHTEELCAQNQYDDRFCGFQLAICEDINFCNNEVYKLPPPPETNVCYFTENPSCIDGITNCHDGGCELLVDCGGPCSACPTCSDNIRNQGEFGIDCGGPCPYACLEETPSKILSIILVTLSSFLVLLAGYILYRLFNIVKYRFSFLSGKHKKSRR